MNKEQKKLWFTSDWHLGEDRIGIRGNPNLFFRPFKTVNEQDHIILRNVVISGFQDGDTLYHLGDVFYEENGENLHGMNMLRDRFPKSEFILIRGNYDTDQRIKTLERYFDDIRDDATLDHFDFGLCYLNHYPVETLELIGEAKLGITGHIHSLWKVQKNLINVGVDAWHFSPVNEQTISFTYNAMMKHYDKNVFPYN